MDRSLKQRLTGASVLIILGVIFIPMLLDGPPTDGYQEIDVPIPDPLDREFETRLLPVNQSADERADATADASRRSATPQADLGDVVETRLIPMSPDRSAGSNQPAPTSDSSRSSPLASTNTDTDPVIDSTPLPVRTSTAPSSTTDAAIVSTVVPGLDRNGNWILQAGTFGSQANATGLAERLSALGWAGTVTPISRNGGTLYQVAAGRFGSDQAADRAATQFASQFQDLKAVVRRLDIAAPAETAPPVIATTPRPTSDSSALSSWMIQVASFGDEANAITLRDQLRSAGYVAHVNHSGASAPYRVRVGPLVNRSDAEATRDRIESAFDLKGILVSHP